MNLLQSLYSQYLMYKYKKMINKPIKEQHAIFNQLVKQGRKTAFGGKYHFNKIRTIEDFQHHIPVQDATTIAPYIKQIMTHKKNILWPGLPQYFLLSSGVTGNIKYLPMTKESIKNQIFGMGQIAYLSAALLKDDAFASSQSLVLTGPTSLDYVNDFPVGRISGIARAKLPPQFFYNMIPKKSTLNMTNHEQMMRQIAVEVLASNNLRFMVGFPAWLIMLFKICLDITQSENLHTYLPNLKMFYSVGTNYRPYLTTLEQLLGHNIEVREMYAASEGFFAMQDRSRDGMLLDTSNGIFYEFIPVESFESGNPIYLTLDQVSTHKDYIMLVSTYAGLWRFNLGDIIRFCTIAPYRIIVCGRTQHELNVIGEHIMNQHVEKVLEHATKKLDLTLYEFTVAPLIHTGKPSYLAHEWIIEVDDNHHINQAALIKEIDNQLQCITANYKLLRATKDLAAPQVTLVPQGTFQNYIKKTKGKIDNQQKIPRVQSTRIIADHIQQQLMHHRPIYSQSPPELVVLS